jgi:hypothetical protein
MEEKEMSEEKEVLWMYPGGELKCPFSEIDLLKKDIIVLRSFVEYELKELKEQVEMLILKNEESDLEKINKLLKKFIKDELDIK